MPSGDPGHMGTVITSPDLAIQPRARSRRAAGATRAQARARASAICVRKAGLRHNFACQKRVARIDARIKNGDGLPCPGHST